MATNEQTAVAEEKQIQSLKADCLQALRAFHAARDSQAPEPAQLKLLDEWSGKCDALFNFVESCIASSDLLGANRSQFWAQEMANTASNLLDTLPDLYEKQWREADRLKQPRLQPSPNAFTAMQNAVALYNPDQVAGYIQRFQALNLPIRGFTKTTNMNTMYDRWEKITMLATIIVFVGLLLAVAVFMKSYTTQGFFIIRVVLAVFAAAFAAVAIPGFLEVKFKIGKSAAIRATGAIAVFVLIYLANPPNLVVEKNPASAPAPTNALPAAN